MLGPVWLRFTASPGRAGRRQLAWARDLASGQLGATYRDAGKRMPLSECTERFGVRHRHAPYFVWPTLNSTIRAKVCACGALRLRPSGLYRDLSVDLLSTERLTDTRSGYMSRRAT